MFYGLRQGAAVFRMLCCFSLCRRSKDRHKFYGRDTAAENFARAAAERHSEETSDSALGIGLYHIRSSDVEGLSSPGWKRSVIAHVYSPDIDSVHCVCCIVLSVARREKAMPGWLPAHAR